MNLWEGRLVRLRALEPGDVEAFVAGDADTEGARAGWRIFPPRSLAVAAEWVEQASRAANDGDEFRLAIEAGGELVGSINSHSCDPVVGTCSYGIGVFPWARRQGYGRDAVIVLLRYLFGERRYQKCTVSTPAFNEASVAFHQALGFQVEGRIRRTVFTDGQHWDEVVLGITAEEYASRHHLR